MILASGFNDEVSNLIAARSSMSCEIMHEGCNQIAVDIHHRRPRGMGGTLRRSSSYASNGLATCRHCHTFVERHREWGRMYGFLVRQDDNPSGVPLWWRCGWRRDDRGHWVKRWVLLDDEGHMVEVLK